MLCGKEVAILPNFFCFWVFIFSKLLISSKSVFLSILYISYRRPKTKENIFSHQKVTGVGASAQLTLSHFQGQIFLDRITFSSVERCGTVPGWTPVTQLKRGKRMSPHPTYAAFRLKASATLTIALNRFYSVVSLAWHTMLGVYMSHSGRIPGSVWRQTAFRCQPNVQHNAKEIWLQICLKRHLSRLHTGG